MGLRNDVSWSTQSPQDVFRRRIIEERHDEELLAIVHRKKRKVMEELHLIRSSEVFRKEEVK
jgi:hypothetical protein